MSTISERIAICNDKSLQERVKQVAAEASKPFSIDTVLPLLVKALDTDGKVAPYEDEDIIAYIGGLA